MFGTRGVANYTNTIEFKAKDADIKKAVDGLAASLGAIDKIVDKLNGKFVKGIRGSISDISKELKTTVKIATDLSNAFVVTEKKTKKITADMKQISVLNKTLKAVKAPPPWERGINVSARKRTKTWVGTENQPLLDAQEALKNYMAQVGRADNVFGTNIITLNRQIAGFKGIAASVNLTGAALKKSSEEYKLFINAVRGQVIAEQKLLTIEKERIKARKDLVIGKGLGLVADKNFETVQNLVAKDQSEIGNTTAEIKLYIGQLEEAVQYLDRGGDLWKITNDAIDTANESLGIQTERQRKLNQQQKDRQKLLDEERKVRSQIAKQDTDRLKKGVMEIFGVLGGKRGGLPQALTGMAAAGGSLEAIKQLIRFIPFVDKKLKANIRIWSEVGQKATTVIGGIRLASIGLSGVLGATTWVTEAIKGFVQFEDVASKVIWSIEGQMGKAFSLFGRLARELPQLASSAMMVMPQAFGLGVGGGGLSFADAFGFLGDQSAASQIADSVLGRRLENRRYGRQGPTDQQKNQLRLERLNEQLENRNRSASDYVRILSKAVRVEQEISRETKMQNIMREHANGTLARQMRQQDLNLKRKKRKEQRDRRQAFEDRKEAFRFQQAEFDAQTYMGWENQDLMVSPSRARTRRENFGGNPRVRRDVWARYQRMQGARRQRRARLNEGLMLGAGFPMLFGGGVGSVGGGVAGAVLQSRMGPGAGFGAQILLSALGQQLDAFVVKTKELGDALRKPTENLQALRDAAGIAGTDIDRTSKRLEELGLKASAAALVQAEISDFANIEGLQAMSEAWQDLSNIIAKLTIQTMSFISGPLTAAIRKMEEILGHSVDAGVLRKTYDKLDPAGKDAFNQRLRELLPERTKDRGLFEGAMSLTPWGTTPYEKIRQGKIPPSVLKEMQAEFDPKSAPGMQEALDAKVKAIAEKDTSDLRKKIALEKERLNMKDSEFDIKNKEIEIARQAFEIEWQRGELRQMEDGLEKDLLQTKIEKLVATRDLNKAELENARILADPVKSSVIQLTKELKNLGDARYQLVQAAQAIGNAFSESFKGIISGSMTAQQALANLFQRTADHFLDMAAQMIAKQIQMKILGIGLNFAGGFSAGGLGSAMGSDFYSGANTGGLSFSDAVKIGGKAAGGPVSGGTPYVVGEKGPELFVPNSSGNIVPNHAMGGANIVVNVDASGSSVEGDAGQAEQLGSMLAAAVQAEIANQQRPGGLLARR